MLCATEVRRSLSDMSSDLSGTASLWSRAEVTVALHVGVRKELAACLALQPGLRSGRRLRARVQRARDALEARLARREPRPQRLDLPRNQSAPSKRKALAIPPVARVIAQDRVRFNTFSKTKDKALSAANKHQLTRACPHPRGAAQGAHLVWRLRRRGEVRHHRRAGPRRGVILAHLRARGSVMSRAF